MTKRVKRIVVILLLLAMIFPTPVMADIGTAEGWTSDSELLFPLSSEGDCVAVYRASSGSWYTATLGVGTIDDWIFFGWYATVIESRGNRNRTRYTVEVVWNRDDERFDVVYNENTVGRWIGGSNNGLDVEMFISDGSKVFSNAAIKPVSNTADVNGWGKAPDGSHVASAVDWSEEELAETSKRAAEVLLKTDGIESKLESKFPVRHDGLTIDDGTVAEVIVEYMKSIIPDGDQGLAIKNMVNDYTWDGVIALGNKLSGSTADSTSCDKMLTGELLIDDFLSDLSVEVGVKIKTMASLVSLAKGSGNSLQGAGGGSQAAANAAMQTSISNAIVEASDNGRENVTSWSNWYLAALEIATGMRPSDSGSPLAGHNVVGTSDNLYDWYGNLRNLGDMNTGSGRYRYEVLALASLGGRDTTLFQSWMNNLDLDTEMQECFNLMKGTGQMVTDYTVAQGWLNDINAAATVSDPNMKKFVTVAQRLQYLIYALGTDGYKETAPEFAWIQDWYNEDNSNWLVTVDMVAGNNIPIITAGNGGASQVKIADIPGEGQYKLGRYILQTIYEVPYFTQFYLKDLNDAISNNTELTDSYLYKAVKSIKDAKDALNMPLLNMAWEYEVKILDTMDPTNIQYTSLAKVWDEMSKLGSSITNTEDPKDPLETGKPMKWFFKDYLSGKLSDYFLQGIAYTSILEPMRSNVYSTEWLKYLGTDFYGKFYNQWGFNRKALYMDKTAGAAESYFTTGVGGSNRKLCTLRDLVESKGDVVLYLDDNFYNSNEMRERYRQNVIIAGGTLDEAVETESDPNQVNRPITRKWWETADKVEEAYNTGFDNIVKTGEATNYSKTFYEMMSGLEGAHSYYPEATVDDVGNTDNAVLSSGRINYYLDSENTGSEIYTPVQGYAVVSAVYRDADLYNRANSKDSQKPVFIASNTAPYMKNATMEAAMTIFNYALVRNLEAAMPVGYAGNIDMDCPLYMDILGNILTESGTVVVPALSNSTIMNHQSYFMDMWSAGLFSVYGLEYMIPVEPSEPDNFKNVMSQAFAIDESENCYVPSSRVLGDSYRVDMSRLSTTSKGTLDTLYQMSYAVLYNSNTSGSTFYDFDSYFQIAMEVLRGAPIENIDKPLEGLDTSKRIDRAGIIAAAKLEELNDALNSHSVNTTLYIPSLSFMPGFNYVAVMAFKIMLLVVITVCMVTIYFDAVSESLGIRTATKCIWAMFITMLTIYTVPAVFEATYYQVNKLLLQDEAIKIAMLNQEKYASGVEIGVTEVSEPDISTELYIKLEDVKVPWYEMYYNSIFSNSYKTMNDLYKDYAKQHVAVANASDVIVKNDGVYVDVQDIFNSSSVDLDQNQKDMNIRNIVQTASVPSQTFSFYSPYYAILDALIENVNYYNMYPRSEVSTDISGWYSYTIVEQKGGKYKTMGLIEPYLTSDKFLYQTEVDPLGLRSIYADDYQGVYEIDPATANYYTSSNREAIKKSAWYVKGMSRVEMGKRLDFMTEQARRFVANNRELIGKISDDTFLKAMALSMATRYNSVFGNEHASSFELYNLSNDDLIRLSIADSHEVMVNSTLSYPRFVYTVGKSVSVFAAALLSIVMWVSGIVKPILVIVAFVTIFVSVFVFRVCMRKEGTSLYGYIITTVLLALTNVGYSVMLKVSMFLPVLGLPPLVCILLQIVLQIAYMALLAEVVWTAFKDWRALGFNKYEDKMTEMKIGVFNFMHKDKGANNPFYGGTSKISTPDKNWKYYDNLMDEHNRRVG